MGGDPLYSSEVNQFLRETPLIYNNYAIFSGGITGQFGHLANTTNSTNTQAGHIDCGGINFNNRYEIIFNMAIPALEPAGSLVVSFQSGIGSITGSGVGFLFISGTDIGVRGFTGSGGLNQVNLGSVTEDTIHRYRILNDNTRINYYINGSLAGSLITLPTGSLYNAVSDWGKLYIGIVGGNSTGRFVVKGGTVVNFWKHNSY